MSIILAANEPSDAPMKGPDGKKGKRVLIVTYTFPPVGGAGVQRVTKFTKYLPRYGWKPTVLTVSNPSVPVLDDSLAEDVSEDIQVIRAKSWEPGYKIKSKLVANNERAQSPLAACKNWAKAAVASAAKRMLQPDPQILWYPGAVAAGKRALKSGRYDAIFVTAPPFSALLIGKALSRYSALPLVVDYRDEWTISNDYLENKNLGGVSRALQTRMENLVLRATSAIVATTQASAQALKRRCQQARGTAKAECIYNGYDAADFSQIVTTSRDPAHFQLVYTGTLWNLTSVSPLVEAISKLGVEHPELANRLEVVLVGRKVGGQINQVRRLQDTGCKVVEHDYVHHNEALQMLCSAHACCLLLSDVPGAERVVPAKLFEYVASKRPILAIIPAGEAWDLLSGMPHANRFLPSDISGIADWLKKSILAKSSENGVDYVPGDGFDRDSQTRQLANILDAAIT
jgi:glycosyltransferase involved in cell wall biosynthesis